MVVRAPAAARTSLVADRRTLRVASDGLRRLTSERSAPNLAAPGLRSATQVRATAPAATAAAGINPDPAWDYKGLLWDYRRIGLPQGWRTTAGSPKVTVGVADTGLDFTHRELASKVKQVIDYTILEDPPICETFFGGDSDADLAARFGGPEKTDWNGHGSWIGGRIAAALNGTGINGIAPRVNLVALKISQWCGSAYDSTILSAFLDAADRGLDIVSISFGGYLDRYRPGPERGLPGLRGHRGLRPQQGHDDRRLGRQRARPGRRRRTRAEPWPDRNTGGDAGVQRHLRPVRGPGRGPRRGRRLLDRPGERPLLGQLPAGQREGTPDDNFSPVCKPISRPPPRRRPGQV